MKIYIVYDTDGGHTRALASAIAEGASQVEKADIFLHHVSEANVRDLADADAIIWGCPGHFGTISAGLKAWIDKLGYLWAHGELINKIGAVFCTTASVHGGLETTMLNLITPMLHHGMIIVGLPATLPENALYGSYYGVGVTCPADSDDSTQLITEDDATLGRILGERVARVAEQFAVKAYEV